MQFELTREFVQELKSAIDQQNNDFLTDQLKGLHPADISIILDELTNDESKYVLDLVDLEVRAEVITELDDDVRAKFLKEFEPSELAEVISYVDSDDAADILNEQNVTFREEIIASIEEPEVTKNVTELLNYAEDTAGGLMAKEMIKANVNWSVNRCIDEIRRQRDEVERIYSIYVVDDRNTLLGILSLKKLILASDEAYVEDLYEKEIISVKTSDREEEVAKIMSKYDLTVIPVVNVQNQLIGRITIDDVVDVIQEQAELDMQILSGISESVESDDSVWALTRARLPWLLIGVFGGLLGEKLLSFFQRELNPQSALLLFIPLIMATGGNVGIQSSTIVVQSLANRTGLEESVFRSLLKSFLVAILNGLLIAIILFGFNYFLSSDNELAVVVSIAIFSVVLIASFFGTVIPLILDKFGVNPAVASGPFITTFNDLMGIAIYFFIAYLLLK